MTFIRTKKIKQKNGTANEYAYLVENNWRKRGKKVKQKSKKYLGKVYRFEKVSDEEFIYNEDYVTSSSYEQIIKDLVVCELKNHGFVKEKNKFVNGEVTVKGMHLLNSKGNKCAVAMNEGILTRWALLKILNFIPVCEEDGYEMAKMYVETGLQVPKELFVAIFSKLYKGR